MSSPAAARSPRPAKRPEEPVERQEEPTWQPISAMGLIGRLIDAQVDGGHDQYETLLRARPYALDDATVERLLRTYGDTADDLWLYDEQLARWSKGVLSGYQRREVERLRAQMAELHEVVQQILALGARLKDETIETLLAKSDAEVGLERLIGGGDR